jgi:hypothetical protein
VQRMVLTANCPKLIEVFRRVSALKSLPRRPADVGTGTVESLRRHIQNYILVRRLREQFTQNLHHCFSNLNMVTLKNP